MCKQYEIKMLTFKINFNISMKLSNFVYLNVTLIHFWIE